MISLEYLAGVIDVNGSLVVTKRADRSGPKVLILIQHRQRVLPDLFAERFGGAVTWARTSAGERWVWQKQGKSAQAVLAQLRPLMRIRMQEADRILGLGLKNRGGSRPRIAKPMVGDELQRISA